MATIDCSANSKTSETFVSFTFGDDGAEIKVPLEELVQPLLDWIPQPVDDDGAKKLHILRYIYGFGMDTCMFGFATLEPQYGFDILLGSPVLRSAYLVYDFEDSVIGVAQSKVNSNESHIVTFSGF